jgi:IS30 family transposase
LLLFLYRQNSQHLKVIFTEQVRAHVNTWLAQDYRPEQIAGRAKLENVECVSHERTEQYAWADEKAKRNLS